MDATLLEENAEDLYEHAPCGYVSTLPNGTIVKVNQTLLDWLGYAREELVGRTFPALLTMGGRIYYETHYAPLLKMHGRVDEIAFDLVAKDERRRSVLVTTIVRRDAHGQPAVYRSTVFDASERRSYERELVLARRAAERAAQERADFLSMVSHEIRTPLTLALGSAETRLATSTFEDERQAWEVARRNNIRILKLVNTLLDFARIEAGHVQPRYQAVDLAAVTHELVEGFRPAVERAGLRLDVALDPLDGPAYLDREMWEKVVLNLLSNALKFTLAGEIVVTLQARDDTYELAVRDTGTGIPHDELAHIFERFHRVRDARGRTQEGTGIGLALVDELLRMHGGSIEVDSQLGAGSTFTARIPRGLEHAAKAQAAASPPLAARLAAHLDEAAQWEAPQATAPLTGTRPRILLADDNADLRGFVASLLSTSYDVDAVADGEAALAHARAHVPDVVVADIAMPGLDGQQLVRALRADARTRLVPVLLLSSGASEDARVGGIEAGADDYIIKPFSARELLARVRAHLDLARLRTSSAHDRERFRAAFAAASVGVALADTAGRFIEVNQAFCTITGYRADELLQLDFLTITHLADRDPSRQVMQDMLAGRRAHMVLEKRYARPDGSVVWVQNNVALVRDVDGSPMQVLAVVEDITARKQGDAERARLLELERAARAQAEAAGRAKDEFLAMLGHELRNPLAPMVTALHLLRLRGEATREHEVLSRQVAHLSRLVDDLLDVSRIARGVVELRRETLELGRVVAGSIETARPLIEQRQQQLTVDVPARGLRVDGDPARLAQIVTNLVTNAAKYSDPGTAIHVSARAEGSRVMLRVRDEGMGIAPDMIERVFDMFTQQPQALDRSAGGLGLGLAIVKNLVQLHGGRVWATSAGLGHGSEFTVELPLVTHRLPTDPTLAPVVEKTGAGRLVLVVDDNQDAANLLAEALRISGHRVLVAYDPTSGLDLARSSPPEIALIDLGLPVMDGRELAARLRAIAPLRICVISGYGQPSDRQRSAEAGIDLHLVKPVDLSTVLAFIERGGGPARA